MPINKIYQKPSINFTLLWQVIRQHLFLFFILIFFGGMFISASILLFLYQRPNIDVFITIFILLFFVTGLFIVSFAFYSIYSSVIYYYEKGLTRRYGLSINAIVTDKKMTQTVFDSTGMAGNHSRGRIHIDEQEFTVYFKFNFNGIEWECADLLGNEKIFDALNIQQKIPVRILPWKPESASIRQRALFNQIKKNGDLQDERGNPKIGEPLIKFPEI